MRPELVSRKGILIWLVPAVVVAGIGGYYLKVRQTGPLTEAERVRQAQARDHRALESSKANEADVFGALVRLSQVHDAEARKESLKHADDASSLVRSGAANGLGYFTDDEATAALKKLLHDKDASVRVQALNGLGHVASKDREDLLSAAIASPESTITERVAAWSSMLTAAVNPQKKETAIDALVRLAQDAAVPANLATNAAMRALSYAPRDERVIRMLRALLEKNSNPSVTPVAIRHLASVRDPGVLKLFGKLLESPDSQIRMAVIQGLRFSCAPERYTMMDHVIRSDRDRAVVSAAIGELQLMPNPQSAKVLQKAVDDKVLSDEESRQARNAVVQIRRAEGMPGADPCAVQAPSTQPAGKPATKPGSGSKKG